MILFIRTVGLEMFNKIFEFVVYLPLLALTALFLWLFEPFKNE